MSATGLLAQLPDLGELEQARTAIQSGLSGSLSQIASNPAELIKPLTDALGSATHMPDMSGLLGPLTGQRGQIAGALPSGLDQQVAAVLPLLQAADQLVTGSAVAPVLDDIRAGRSINDIAKDALELMAGELLGALPQISGGAIPPEAQAAITGLSSAVGGLGGAPDPAALANVLAEHLLGVPIGPLGGLLTARGRLFDLLSELQAAAGTSVDGAEQALLAQIDAAAARLEGLNPTSAADWQAALAALQQAAAGLAALRTALEAIPGKVYGGLGQLDLDHYKAELRQALQALPALGTGAAGGLGRFTSLGGIADNILEPLDTMTATLASASPADFTARLRDGLNHVLSIFDALAESIQDNPVLHLFDDLKQAVDQVAGAIHSVRELIDSGLKAIVGAVEAVVGEFNTIKQQVEAALHTLEDAIKQLDVDALAHAVEGVFEQLDNALAALPLKDLKDKLDQALSTVEGLVKTLSEAAQGAITQIESLAGSLDQLSFRPLVDPVIGAINTIKDTVSQIDPSILPDALKDELHTVVEAFKSEFGGDPQQWFKSNVTDTLDQLFDKAVQAVRELVEGLQQKLKQFAESVGKLDPSALLEPVVKVFKQLDDAIAGLSGEKLIAPARKLVDDAIAALQAVSPEKLLAPLEQAFEHDVLDPLKSFKPSTLLAPLVEAFKPVEELLGKLDFSEALKGLGQAASDFLGTTQGSLAGALDFSSVPGVGGMAGQVQPVLELFKPSTTIEDWTGALTDLLNNYRPSTLLGPIKDVLAPVESALTGATDELLMATFGRLKGLAGLSTTLNTSATLGAFTGAMEQIAAALEAHQPTALIAGLNADYTRITAALGRIDAAALPAGLRAQYDAVRAAIAALDPAALAALSATFAALPARIRQAAARTLDLSDLTATFGAKLDAIVGLLPGFLGGDLTPDAIRQELDQFSPTALIQHLDQAFDAFLAAAQRFGPAIQAVVEGAADQLGQKLTALSPAALFERFDELFAPIRTALADISPEAIAAELDQAYAQMLDKLAQVNPKVIRELAQELFDTVVGALDGLKQKLLDPIAAAIDTVLARIRETLKALDPQALIIGLGNLFALIRKALDEIDLTALLDHLVKVFDRLRADLNDALLRTAGSFVQMLEALPT